MRFLLLTLFFINIFANEMVIYQNNVAQYTATVKKKKASNRFVLYEIPNDTVVNSFRVYDNKILEYSFRDKKEFNIYDFKRSFVGKDIIYKNKKVKMIEFSVANRILIKDADKYYFVKLDDVTFTNYSYKKHLPSRITLKLEDATDTLKYSYLVNNIGYRTFYTIDLNSNSVEGFVKIHNLTNKSYKISKLHLVLGDINYNKPGRNYPVMYKAIAKDVQAKHVKETNYASYKLYTINKNIVIHPRSKTFVNIITQTSKITSSYKVSLPNPKYRYHDTEKNFNRYISFKTSKEFIKGKARVYKDDIFIGEAYIKNTPKNTILSLNIQKDFALSVKEDVLKKERNPNDFSKFDIIIKYTVTNKSNFKKDAKIYIPFEINKYQSVRTSQKYKYKNQHIIIPLTLKPNSTKTFTMQYKGR